MVKINAIATEDEDSVHGNTLLLITVMCNRNILYGKEEFTTIPSFHPQMHLFHANTEKCKILILSFPLLFHGYYIHTRKSPDETKCSSIPS